MENSKMNKHEGDYESGLMARVISVHLYLLIAFVLIFFLASVSKAAVWCVSNSTELQSALTAAQSNGEDDEIRIVQGTYHGNFVYDSYYQDFDLAIEGGYAGGCSSRVVDPNNTVLDGDGGGRVLFLRSNRPVDPSIDGISLTNGDIPSGLGGGLYAHTPGGTLSVTNCNISFNEALDGGGLWASTMSAGDVIISNSIFQSNHAYGDGGGLNAWSSTGAVMLTNNTVWANTADQSGGGVFAYSSDGTVTLTDNFVKLNRAYSTGFGDNGWRWGGGGVWAGSGINMTLDKNTIEDNRADYANGGGLHIGCPQMTLTNNVIVDNYAYMDGGGLSAHNTGAILDLIFTNNTITNNTGWQYGGGAYIRIYADASGASLHNNIIWNNSGSDTGNDLYIDNDGDDNSVASPVQLHYNDFDQSWKGIYMKIPFTICGCNLNNEDPLFVQPFYDYHIKMDSPCIDKGGSFVPELPATDVDGDPRIIGPAPDIGADEFVGAEDRIAEIIGTWSSGIWYRNVAASSWTKMNSGVPSGDIAAGDFTGDGKADVASCWNSGLWYQNGATLGWTKVSSSASNRLTAGDVTGDGRAEIIGTWSSGIWYRNVAASSWTKMNSGVPSGDIAAGDFTGDGKDDVASNWSSGLWYQNGATLGWKKVTSTAPYELTAGDVTGDRRAEIIGTWDSGIWYRNVAASSWTKMNSGVPSGDIAAGDFTGDKKADVASIWNSGLWYQNGATRGWTKVTSTAPYKVTCGDVTGD